MVTSLPSNVPMISALTLCGMPQFIQSEIGNRALQVAYDKTGLPQGIMDIEDAYIPEAALSGFISAAARAAGDDKIGLSLIPFLSVASYGTWGRYVLEAPTLQNSLARIEQVIGLHASYRTCKISADGSLIWIRYQFQVPKNADYRNLAYSGLGVLCNMVRHFVGPDWQPAAVELDIPKPRRMASTQDAFACPITFGSNSIGVAFRRNLLFSPGPVEAITAPVSFADVLRSRTPRIPNCFTEATAEVIRLQLRKGTVSMDAAARTMAMGTRRLRRAMDREGTSFREVTRRVRTDLAKELIAGTALSISAISSELGYANAALFSRAFSRDVGQNPSTYRLKTQMMSK